MKSFEIDPICIYSEDENKAVCEEFGFESYFFENDPLGKKLNFGVEMALKSKWDYLMQINSDDILREEIFELYKPYFEKEEKCFGVGDVYFYDLHTGKVAHASNAYPLGCARLIHRSIFEKENLVKVRFVSSCSGKKFTHGKGEIVTMSKSCADSFKNIVKILSRESEFKLYTDTKNRVLDFDSDTRLAKVGVTSVKVETNKEVYVVDLKSETNIWSFNWFEDKIVKKDVLKYFPEKNEIRKLRQVYNHSNVHRGSR